MREYMFNNPVDMIDLAKLVQTRISKGVRFTFNGVRENYKYFWDICSEELEKEYTGVVVTDTGMVTFIKSIAE